MCGRACAPEHRFRHGTTWSDFAERQRMKASFTAAIEGVDALLTPTAVTPAPPLASTDQKHDTRGVHAPGQLPRPVCGGVAEWFHCEWIAQLAADHLLSLCRADGAAYRPCLSGRT
jgi:hypothetical protein